MRIVQNVSGTFFLCSKLWCACIQVFCTLVSSSNLLYIVFRILSTLCTFRLKVLIINHLTSVDKCAFCLHFVCTACTFCLHYLRFCLHCLHFCLHCLHGCQHGSILSVWVRVVGAGSSLLRLCEVGVPFGVIDSTASRNRFYLWRHGKTYLCKV